MPFQIALDGPVGEGKGTVSRLVSERMELLYVDTGAMYRSTVVLAQREGIDINDETALVTALKKCTIEMRNPLDDEKDGRLTTVILDGEDISWKIRTEEVSRQVSIVAAHGKVREELVKKQQEIARTQEVIMEGRDIALRVLPDATFKIFLTADPIIRAKRRHLELQTRGQDVTYNQVYQDLLKRDEYDSTRKIDPLQILPEHLVVDTSDLTVEQAVDLIVTQAKLLKS